MTFSPLRGTQYDLLLLWLEKPQQLRLDFHDLPIDGMDARRLVLHAHEDAETNPPNVQIIATVFQANLMKHYSTSMTNDTGQSSVKNKPPDQLVK